MAAAVAVGCKKNDIPSDNSGYEASGSAISFSNSPDNWTATKGAVVGSDNFNEMEVYAFYTAQNEWASAEASDIESFMYDQAIDKQASGVWSYSPVKYWPNNQGDKITFYSLSPRDEIQTTIDETTAKPKFKYVSAESAEENSDLMAAVIVDKTKDNNGVNFEMKHALTRINIEARTINATVNDDVTGQYDIYYTVESVVMSDILSEGEMTVSDANEISWNGQQKPIDFSITDATLSDIAIKNDEYTPVCKDGNALFVMPQAIEASTISTPTVQLRICKHYTYKDELGVEYHSGEVIYAPVAVSLPSPDKAGWLAGQWINLQFTFDVDKDNPTPLTVISEVYKYTEVDVDVDINRNIYIYSDIDEEIVLESSQSTVGVTFCTNYANELAVGVNLTAQKGGFVFYSNGSQELKTPAYLSTNSDGSLRYQVNLDNSDNLYYSVKKQTREDLGMFNSDVIAGINTDKNDAVYTLTLDLSGVAFTSGEFQTTIGVQMLSNAGGMITKKFPITLKKN